LDREALQKIGFVYKGIGIEWIIKLALINEI
jgi:hypothetical protein